MRGLKLHLCCYLGINILSLFLLNCEIWSQPKPGKWGKVTLEDLKLTEFPEDSNAHAIVLFDYGEVNFRRRLNLIFERHTRIKIFDQAGFDWGTVYIPFYAANNQQKVKGVKGQTINLGEGDKIVRHKLDKNSIFEEDMDEERRRVKFTLPALKPGSIIEFTYKILSENPVFLRGWKFQSGIPTKWSEFRANIPGILEYGYVVQGIFDFFLSELQTYQTKRWIMKDVPAFYDEPFMTTREDHIMKIEFQLSAFLLPNGERDSFLDTWKELAEKTMKLKFFGKQINQHKILQKLSQSLTQNIADPLEQMKVIYNHVQRKMAWDETYDYTNDEKLDYAYKIQKANSGGVNLILLSMLLDAGLDAKPVLISTRKHGKPKQLYPLASQFNHVIVRIQIGPKSYLLDATDPFCPYTLLPQASLNEFGWIVDVDNPRWIEVTPGAKFEHAITARARLKNTGDISVELTSIDDGYSSLKKRRSLSNTNEDAFIRTTILDDISDVVLDSFYIENKINLNKPLVTRAFFKIPEYSKPVGEYIYINPMLVDRQDENPFKSRIRNFPIDFAFKSEWDYYLELYIPDRFEVRTLPQDIHLRKLKDKVEFHRVTKVFEDKITIRSRKVIHTTTFRSGVYKSLRKFNDEIISAHEELIVLKRKAK